MSIKARLVDRKGDLTGVASNPLPTELIPRYEFKRLYKTPVQASGSLEPDGTYYHYIQDFAYYDCYAIQWDITAGSGSVTITVEATCGHDELYEADVSGLQAYTWIDVTNDLFGFANSTADDLNVIDTPFPVQYLRVKAIHATGAADDSALTLWIGRR